MPSCQHLEQCECQIMKAIVHNNFSQYSQLAEQFCDTGDLHLGETSLRDTFYDIVLSLNNKDTTNKTKWQTNKLGRLLMAGRTVLAAKNLCFHVYEYEHYNHS